MKSFAFATLALVLSVSTVSFAKDKTVQAGVCVVRANGEYNGQIVEGKEFFSKAKNFSDRNNSCVIAKIYGKAETTRIYFNGRRPIAKNNGLSDSDTSEVLKFIGLTESQCTEFSCVEAL